MSKPERSIIEIFGDRQHGKSYLLMLAAIDAARQGKSVLYDTGRRVLARERFFTLEQHCLNLGIFEKAWRANGAERLQVAGGGTIYFYNQGVAPDVHILDDCSNPPLPGAERIIRSHCTEGVMA